MQDPDRRIGETVTSSSQALKPGLRVQIALRDYKSKKKNGKTTFILACALGRGQIFFTLEYGLDGVQDL